MQDVTYTELIILEYKEKTELADAKYDGEIDILDVTQIELIILGQEKKLTILDGNGESVTVCKPGKYHTYGKGDKFDQMCLIAGGRNIAEDLPEYLQGGYSVDLDPEWVVAQNPDFIIVQAERAEVVHGYNTDDSSEMAAVRDEIMNRPELANVNAVKNGDVYILWCDSRNDGTSGSIGAAYMAKLFHSDLFEDLDPLAIHQEYLDRFQHFDFNVYEHGVFVYPPLEES